MNINIVIVAHQRRKDIAHKLAVAVKADHICWDDGTLGPNANHRAAWDWHYCHSADYAIVLEDDAIPCKNFRQQLALALPAAPTHLVSLYLGRQRPPHWQATIEKAVDRAVVADACFIVGRHNFHAVALAAKRPMVRIITMALSLYGIYPVDEALSTWLERNQTEIAYTVPSLVNHNDQLPTLIEHRDGGDRPPGRVAWRHGAKKRWTSMSVPMIAPTPKNAVSK